MRSGGSLSNSCLMDRILLHPLASRFQNTLQRRIQTAPKTRRYFPLHDTCLQTRKSHFKMETRLVFAQRKLFPACSLVFFCSSFCESSAWLWGTKFHSNKTVCAQQSCPSAPTDSIHLQRVAEETLVRLRKSISAAEKGVSIDDQIKRENLSGRFVLVRKGETLGKCPRSLNLALNSSKRASCSNRSSAEGQKENWQ